jgi:polyphenol oxidase
MPNSSTRFADSSSKVKKIDALLQRAGSLRNSGGKAAEASQRVRRKSAPLKRMSQAELIRPASVPTESTNGVNYFAVSGWKKLPWLWHGFSTRKGGVSQAYCAEEAPGELNLGFTAADEHESVVRNRQLFAEAVTGSAKTPMVTLRQIHSSVLAIASAAKPGRDRLLKADGLMTEKPGLLLAVQTADCIPVLVADRKRRVVAAFHAGWRGTAKRIVENGIGRMRLEFGSLPEDLVAAIGPGIGACCYSVGEDVFSSFESQFDYAGDLFREVYDTDPVRTKYPMLFLTQRAPGHSPMGPHLHLDLVEANRRQLLAAGLKSRAIHLIRGCTSCQPELFFSHRATKGHAGRMMSVIGITPR